jgi:hypothetical protein
MHACDNVHGQIRNILETENWCLNYGWTKNWNKNNLIKLFLMRILHMWIGSHLIQAHGLINDIWVE